MIPAIVAGLSRKLEKSRLVPTGREDSCGIHGRISDPGSRNSDASTIAHEKLGELHHFESAMVKKTTEQKAAEALRYIAASGAANAVELEPFLTDPNQAIRAVAAMNPDADEEILDRFANDKFWGVRMEVVRNANVSQATLRRLLESDTRKRGVVHHAAREKLEERGVAFGAGGMPEDAA